MRPRIRVLIVLIVLVASMALLASRSGSAPQAPPESVMAATGLLRPTRAVIATTTTTTSTTTQPPPTEPLRASTEPQEAPQPVEAPSAPQTASAAPGDPYSEASWDRLAQCESGGDWSINTGNGYYGGIQFSLSSWRGVGGTGYPHENSRAEQIHRGRLLWEQGGWNHWPGCSRSFGWV